MSARASITLAHGTFSPRSVRQNLASTRLCETSGRTGERDILGCRKGMEEPRTVLCLMSETDEVGREGWVH